MINENKIAELYGLTQISKSDRIASLKYFQEAVSCQKSGHELSAAQNITLFLKAAGADELPSKEFEMITERTVEIVKAMATDDPSKIRLDKYKWDRGLWASKNLREAKRVSKDVYRWRYPVMDTSHVKKVDKKQYRWKEERL